MIRAYLAKSSLTAPLIPKQNTAQIDTETWNYLDTLLAGDYCYLVIGGREVVRVLGTLNSNTILLARTKLEQCVWPAGAEIKYQLTAGEILDTIATQQLTLTVSGALTLEGSELGYPVFDLASVGGVASSGEDGAWLLEDVKGNSCECDAPPPIPLNYQKLRITASGYRVTDDGTYRIYA